MNDERIKVLYVDDEEGNLLAFRAGFRRELEVFTAKSGQEGLALLENTPVQVVISDQRMPGMNGTEFLAQVRERWPRAVRIMLTGYSDLQGVVDATPTGSSMACFTCHDGTQAVGAILNLPNNTASITYTAGGLMNATGFVTGTALLGKDLSNDHPISITYPTTDPGLVAKATVLGLVNGVKLFGTAGSEKVQCASCHDVHVQGTLGTTAPFLRTTMVGSALCIACHIK